ncbi:MAG: 5-formyltetrahydrofolate cyclo-ligase [Candidatus Tokpelaia hoelldobleri]|uniref:5-formyltetrahydrofolate cyclo-ligase n=1 Tax=Candidatus Tokpelaia hoelldobleri TaxID=1902579 RepID=A0A1U9JWS0_9HYPH|nr:MAG: 5-formyltetrahydrofolate cyclo-ligase [Candidatus Tokpelaia hoelldoblerii]
MPQTKETLRQTALSRRDSLSANERADIAQKLVSYADQLFPHITDETVAAFWPIRSEIDPRPLMATLVQQGAALAIPAMTGAGQMVFRHYQQDMTLVATGLGTFSPPDRETAVTPTTILLPLAAFDDKGNRIGYGGGYYDRAIARCHAQGAKPRLVGLAFDCQQVAAIPAESHDIALDAIMTESGLRWFIQAAMKN